MYTYHNGWTEEKLYDFCRDFASRRAVSLYGDNNGYKRTDDKGNIYELRYKYPEHSNFAEDCTLTINGQLVRSGLSD